LTDRYHDDGSLLIGVGIADALALAAALHFGTHYWAAVGLTALVGVVGSTLLVDRKAKWLTKALQGSAAARADAPVSRHEARARGALFRLAVFGGFTAAVALLWTQGIVTASDVGIVPGGLVAAGLTELVRTARVRSWERDGDSELLVVADWMPWRARAYFVRPN
jgi:hypothetical protein